MSKNKPLLREVLAFIWDNKVWWLLPILITLLGLTALMVLGQGSVLSPFIYVLF
ncbi:MAG: DUF5989 family protein [Candidatus Dojkabacteria bacterium]